MAHERDGAGSLVTWEVCTDTFPVRPWPSRCRRSPRFGTVWVREYTTRLDRNYWHPCNKGHVAQCRGQVGLMRAARMNSWAYWYRGRGVLWPHGCQNAVFTPRLCGQRQTPEAPR